MLFSPFLRVSAMAFALLLQLYVSSAFANDAHKVIILYTNDVHTSMSSGVGYDGVAAYKKAMQAKYGTEDVLLVDAGDVIQGGPAGILTKGEALVPVLNSAGYDYMTLGNHEFDYGLPRLFELIKALNTQVLSCNITRIEDGSLVFTPFALKEFHGVKVAFIGITTPESFTKSTPKFFQDDKGNYIYSFAEGGRGQDLYNKVQESVNQARAQGAEMVIALSHLGIDEESSPWTSLEVIQNTHGITAVLDGHSHSTVAQKFVKNKQGKDVLLSQTGSRLQNLGILTLDTAQKTVHSELINTIPEKDAETAAVIEKIRKELAVILEKDVATTQVALIATNDAGQTLVRRQETNLGNLVADAFRAALGTDVALINGGGIRNSVDIGPITYNEIISVLPYGNDGVSIAVSGQMLLDALEMGIRTSPAANGGFMNVSGMRYTVDNTIPSSVKTDDKGNFIKVAGPYRVKDVFVGEKPLDLKATYSMAAANYTALNSGDGMTMFRDAELLKDKYMVDNEILIQYLTKNLGGVVGEEYAKPTGQGRIVFLKN